MKIKAKRDIFMEGTGEQVFTAGKEYEVSSNKRHSLEYPYWTMDDCGDRNFLVDSFIDDNFEITKGNKG